MMQFMQFSNEGMRGQAQGGDFGMEIGMREPIFDIRVSSQKSSPFSTVAQNERAKELYGMGFFNPQLADQAMAALDMMDFEGIEKVRQRVAQNGMLFQQVQMMQAQLMQLAAIVDAQNGTSIAQGIAGGADGKAGGAGAAMAAQPRQTGETETNQLGKVLGTPGTAGGEATAAKARTRAAEASTPRV